MTLSEIAVAIEEPGAPRPVFGQHVSDGEREDYAARWRRMTLAERLREGARELGLGIHR